MSYKQLELKPADAYIDIAAQNYPFAFFMHEKFGGQVFRQDLYYLKKGIHGNDVGGDASRLPFIREAHRVLRNRGKMINKIKSNPLKRWLALVR